MSWKKGTIKLAPAQTIFSQFDISPIQSEVDEDKVIGYRAMMPDGTVLKDSGLTKLCQRIVEGLTKSAN